MHLLLLKSHFLEMWPEPIINNINEDIYNVTPHVFYSICFTDIL